MAIKTSQLQIRVTEREKAALKRLARAANLSVSRYVLTRALPSRQAELARLTDALARPGGEGRAALADLHALIRQTPGECLAEDLAAPSLERLHPILRNELAAAVEQAASTKGVEPPGWVADIVPLARPHFGWSLSSLQPHQIRVTPVPFKRRGIFFDPATRPKLVPRLDTSEQGIVSGAVQKLAALATSLASSELKVEFYLLGGALLFQPFHSRPRTAHVSALFRASAEVGDVVAALGQREGWGTSWLQDAVKELLVGGLRPERYLETPNLAVFVPPAEYVLAVKVAALRLGTGARALDDLRYVLRALNVGTPAAALEIVGRYFGRRQLPPDAGEVLEGLLAP